MEKEKTIWRQIKSNAVALISLTVALVGLGYNTWRNEQTEANRNVRVAGFQLMENIVELQTVVFFVRYPNFNDSAATVGQARGDLRDGWALVLSMRDLSYSMPDEVQQATQDLFSLWEQHFDDFATDDQIYKNMDSAIDRAKAVTRETIMELD